MSITGAQIDRISAARTLSELHAALADAHILQPDARFMHVEMDITNRCNIRCVMCYHSFDEMVKSRAVVFPADAFDAFVGAALPHAHTLTLSLGSEPPSPPKLLPRRGNGLARPSFSTLRAHFEPRALAGWLRYLQRAVSPPPLDRFQRVR